MTSPHHPVPESSPDACLGLDYQPYSLLTLSLDTEWTRRKAYDAASDPLKAFGETCERIAGNCAKIERKSHTKTGSTHLHKVMGFMPVSHADAFCMLLSDNVETQHELVSDFDCTLEEATIGFCPKIKPLFQEVTGQIPEGDEDSAGFRDWLDEKDRSAIFPDLKEVFEKAKRLPETKYPEFRRDCESPLVLFTSLKFGALASLGLGLGMEYGVCRAMIRCALKTIRRIAGKDRQSFEKYADLRDEDLESLRICLLDLQSQEQLGLLFFTSNLTLPAAILSRLRALTIHDVLNESTILRERFAAEKHYASIRDAYIEAAGLGTSPDNHLPPHVFFADSHVFRWTRSLAGFRGDLFKDVEDPDGNPKVHGWVDFHTELQIPPGHQQELKNSIVDAQKKRGNQRQFPLRSCPDGGEFCRHALGRCDRIVRNGLWKSDTENNLVLLGELLPGIKNFFDCAGSGSDSAPNQRWRSLVGMGSMIVIPVPVSKDAGKNGDKNDYYRPPVKADHHHSPFDSILRNLKGRLFPSEPDSSKSNGSGFFDRKALRQGMNSAHLPRPLRRSIENLFDNYCVLLANPYIFESVVDLWDAFRSFHFALCEDPEISEPDEKSPSPSADQERITEISKFAAWLNWALEHRLYRAFPEDRVRDVDIDYRGGLSHLLAAADTILKCAVGTLRHEVLKDADDSFEKVGVIQHVGFMPGVALKKYYSCAPVAKTQLAVLRTDVAHLHHVPSYHDFWHEAFHLVYDVLAEPGTSGMVREELSLPPALRGIRIPRDKSQWFNEDVILQQRTSEIFAHLLTTLFISPLNPDVVAKHLAIQYANSITSCNGSKRERFVFYLEKRLEWFVVGHLLGMAKKMAEEAQTKGENEDERNDKILFWHRFHGARASESENVGPAPWDEDEFLGGIDKHVKDAVEYLREMAPYHWEFGEIFENGHSPLPDTVMGAYIKEKARRFLATTGPYLGAFLRIAGTIYLSARRHALEDLVKDPEDLDDPGKLRKWDNRLLDWQKKISDFANNGGRALRDGWMKPEMDEDSGSSGEIKLDPAFFLCSLLNGVLKNRISEVDECLKSRKNIHRRCGNGDPDDLAKFYCDPTSGGSLQCQDPAKRGKRLVRHIRVIKAAVGVAADLRLRRIVAILGQLELVEPD